MLRDSHTPYESACFYCITSAIYTPFFILGLFLSNAYLLAGQNSYIPVYVFIVIAELLKYAYIQLVYHKDITYSPKQGFKLFSIIFYFMKQIKVIELLRNVLVMTGFACIVFVIAVLFGAEVLAKHEETMMFSCLITVLTVFPISLHQGVVSIMQFLNGIQGNDAFTQVLLRNIQFTVLGAWLGAFVIPLDWDREWQVWPIPCSLGALLGFAVSQVFSLVELFTKFSGKSTKLNSKYR
ncbi:hypothetical protein J6590_062066 [Homalodisca vitripennis]|nr:hypothetical protein J6590_062066 [Homalodisca vitripennis]